MVSAYLLPMKAAAVLFPLLALPLFLPTAIVLYRRHGVLSHWRAMSLVSFLYYGVTALCMTIVPLPGPSVDVCRVFRAVAHAYGWAPGARAEAHVQLRVAVTLKAGDRPIRQLREIRANSVC